MKIDVEDIILDWNRHEIDAGDVFHFNHSLRPFILIFDYSSSEEKFLDIENYEAYSFEELEYQELYFYEDVYEGVTDEDFKGVAYICKLKNYC